MPSGGARPGSGRKKKTESERWLAGNPSGSSEVQREKPQPLPVRLLPAPDGLTADEVKVWNRLAPHAAAARTLVPGTADAFVELCRAMVLERELALDADERGGPSHRGVMQRVEVWMLRFKLSPMGKALEVPEETPADPFAEFDGGVVQ
jgi:hypothetical protein